MYNEVCKVPTNEALLRKLHNARTPTAEEIREQRVSFVYGALDKDNVLTREEVRQMVERNR